MKTCPKCSGTLTEKHGVYTPPLVKPVPIPNATWSFCPTCGYESIPKALQKAIKRTNPRLTDDCS